MEALKIFNNVKKIISDIIKHEDKNDKGIFYAFAVQNDNLKFYESTKLVETKTNHQIILDIKVSYIMSHMKYLESLLDYIQSQINLQNNLLTFYQNKKRTIKKLITQLQIENSWVKNSWKQLLQNLYKEKWSIIN